MKRKKHWYDYLWILSLTYLTLGFFNILFAWLGLICFFLPLLISVVGGSKAYCNRYCGRGQLFGLLGGRFGLSRRRDVPRWMKSKAFRYGFLVFFMLMFLQMLWSTFLVFSGAEDLRQVVTLLWTDLQAALAVGLCRRGGEPLGGPVCLWVLQRDAHLHRAGAGDHGAVQAPLLVRLLPHGHHDPAGMRRAQRLRLRQGSLPGPRQGNRLLRRGQLIFAEIKPGRISRGEMRPGFSFFMGAALSAAWPGTWPAGR